MDLEGDHAGLHHGQPILLADLQDPVHLVGGQDDPALDGGRGAAQAGRAPSRRDRDSLPIRKLHDSGDLLTGAGDEHDVGLAPGIAVVGIRVQILGGVEASLRAQDFPELSNQGGFHGLILQDGG